MRIDRDDANPQWIATQGLWYGLGATRLAAVLDCLWACADALLYGLERGEGFRCELRRWWREVFVVENG